MAVWELRDAEPGEAVEIASLHRRASYVWPRDRVLLEAHPELLQPQHEAIAQGRVRVAVDPRGRLLGFSTVLPPAAGVVELDSLFVEPDAMGVGVGRALVEDAAARAAALGAHAGDVTANDNAVGFYERAGFRITGEAGTRFGPAPRMRRNVSTARP